jgi:hypothetical protein
MKLPGVLSTAVGLDDNGRAALVVYVDQDSRHRRLQKEGAWAW